MLKNNVANLEGVDEKYHDLYTQKDDGSYSLSGVEIPSAKTPKPPASTIDPAEFNRLQKAEQDRIAAEESAEAAALAEKAKNDNDFDSLRDQLNLKHAEDIKKRDEQIASLVAENDQRQISEGIRDALKEHNGKDTLDLHVAQSVKMVDGQVRIIGDDGKPKLSAKENNSDFMTISEHVETMRGLDKFKDSFTAVQRSGGGSQTSIPSRVSSRADLKTTADQAAYIKEHGSEAYLSLSNE